MSHQYGSNWEQRQQKQNITMYPPPLYGVYQQIQVNPYEKTPYDDLDDSYKDTDNNAVQDKKLYYCEICDKDCSTQKAFQSHLRSHVKCRFEGCTFSGSQKVVSSHYSQQHGKFSGSGFKEVTVAVPGFRPQRFNVCVGNSPDDIASWIEERKRNWPSRANIARKEAETRRRSEEGGFMVFGETPSKRSKGNHSSSMKETVARKKDNSSDDEDPNSLLSLIGGYGSSSDEENEPKDSNVVEKERRVESKPRPCRFFMRRGKCMNDSCAYLHDMEMYEIARSKRKQGRKTVKAVDEVNKESLLRKLLRHDIRRETSLTLQCIRFLVDCNLFQSSSK